MVRLRPAALAWAALGSLLLTAVPATPRAAASEDLYRKNCQTCHSLADDGVKRAGPSLHAIFGRKAGSVDGFPYSEALKQAGFAWTAEAMDAWLTNPQAYLPGTYMMYRQSDPEIRAAIIAYLQAAAGGDKQ